MQSWEFLQEKWKLIFTQNLIHVYSFIAALFVIAKNWKLLKCPSMVNAEQTAEHNRHYGILLKCPSVVNAEQTAEHNRHYGILLKCPSMVNAEQTAEHNRRYGILSSIKQEESINTSNNLDELKEIMLSEISQF